MGGAGSKHASAFHPSPRLLTAGVLVPTHVRKPHSKLGNHAAAQLMRSVVDSHTAGPFKPNIEAHQGASNPGRTRVPSPAFLNLKCTRTFKSLHAPGLPKP